MSLFAALLLLGAAPSPAPACADVLTMVDVEVPTAVIVDVLASGGRHVERADLRCLRKGGAPREVVEAARVARRPAARAPVDPVVEPPRAPPGSPLGKAIALLEAGEHRAASIALAALPADARVQYEMARALRGMGLYHSAQFHFIEALRGGPADPSYGAALTRLARIGQVIGDSTDLAYIVRRVPPEAYPAAVRDELEYHLAQYLYATDQLAEAAERLTRVDETSPRYWPATYTLGVIYTRQGGLQRGLSAFAEVAKGASDRELRDLARLQVANVHFSLERFAEAATDADLPADSPRYAESRLRLGWARFMAGQSPDAALDAIPADAWLPEAALLRGLEAYGAGRHAEALSRMDAFLATYEPVRAQLSAIVAEFGTEEGLRNADAAFRRFADPATSPLPPGFLAYLHRDRELPGYVAHLALLDAEERFILRQPEAWRAVHAERLVDALRGDRLRLQRRAGLGILYRFVLQRDYLRDLLHQARVLRFESADAIERAALAEGTVVAERSTALLRELVDATPPGPVRADALVRLAARVDDAEAISLCEGLLAAPPPSWDPSGAAYVLALVDTRRALPHLARVVTEWPSSAYAPPLWLLLGEEHFARGRFAEARAAYERAAAPLQGELSAYATYKLGWTLHALGDHAAGQETLNVAIQATRDETLRAHAIAERDRLAGL